MRWMRWTAKAGLALCLAGGCGGGSGPIAEPPPEQTALRELGEMYRVYSEQHQKPPTKDADLASFAPAFSHGSMALVNREVTVAWGAGITPGSEAVLAYEKAVPKDGGTVLLQDGETLKKMTAEDFKAAPKAGGK